VHVPKRENPIVNRLNKTKVVREVDHEAERIERMKKEGVERRAAAAAKVRLSKPRPHDALYRPTFSAPSHQKKADLELAKAREAEKAARSYDTLFSNQEAELEDDEEARGRAGKSVRELEEDFM